MRLYIIRHADPDYPNNTITAQGHLEAQALARRLAGEKLNRIYSSPLGRALDTMRYTAEATHLEPGIEDWTVEFQDVKVVHGDHGELASWQIPGEIVRNGDENPFEWQQVSYLTPTIRTKISGMQEQSDRFIARHGYERSGGRYRINARNHERIAVFCHNGFGLAWLAHLLALPFPLVWTGFWLAPTSVTTVVFEERSKDWAVPRALGVSDVSHLHAAGVPVQPSGLRGNFY